MNDAEFCMHLNACLQTSEPHNRSMMSHLCILFLNVSGSGRIALFNGVTSSSSIGGPLITITPDDVGNVPPQRNGIDYLCSGHQMLRLIGIGFVFLKVTHHQLCPCGVSDRPIVVTSVIVSFHLQLRNLPQHSNTFCHCRRPPLLKRTTL